MQKLIVTNTSSVPLNGKKPGETFKIEIDDAGVPLDQFWRNRFDERAIEKGYLTVKNETAKSAPPAAKPSPSVASPETQKTKAR